MKFAEQLAAHITPDWRSQYINYEDMKGMLYKALEEAPCYEQVGAACCARYYFRVDEKFLVYCNAELVKINNFYTEKLAAANRTFTSLQNELAEIQSEWLTADQRKHLLLRKRFHKNERIKKMSPSELRYVFSELYCSVILIQNYQLLNITGFSKIMKKHDKLFATNRGSHWYNDFLDNASFTKVGDVERLITDIENTVTYGLEKGNRERAMNRLRVPPIIELIPLWTTFKVGLYSGMFFGLLFIVILTALFKEKQYNWTATMNLYRLPIMIAIYIVLTGVNVYGWRSCGVNHILIFDLNPIKHITDQQIIEMGSLLGILWNLSLLAHLYSDSIGIPPYINPLILYFVAFCFMMNPIQMWHYDARFWILRILGRVFLAPMYYVRFADFWIAEQLTSLVPIFSDILYLLGFYSANTNWTTADHMEVDSSNFFEQIWWIRLFVSCLPPWFRLAQCLRRYWDTKQRFPHLGNVGKYATIIIINLFAFLNLQTTTSAMCGCQGFYFTPLMVINKVKHSLGTLSYITSRCWMIASFVSSVYMYSWDIMMDWGFFEVQEDGTIVLRDETVYPSRKYYFLAVATDMVIRFGWAVSVTFVGIDYFHSNFFTYLSPFEIFRRFIWNFFRLENEHLFNCGKFRSLQDISITPLNASYATHVFTMMDEIDGVMEVRKTLAREEAKTEE